MTAIGDVTAPPKFASLSPSISLYAPLQPTKGHLVILATWMGAAQKHIDKYTTTYTKLIPSSRILLIKGTIDGVLYSYSAQRKAIKPAAKAVRAILDECGYVKDSANPHTPPHILIHVFSNGGANSIQNLLHVLQQEVGAPLPLVGLICDSALAKGGYEQNYKGFVRSLPKGVIFRVLGPPFINFALLVLNLSIALGRYERPEDLYRGSIINEKLVRVGDPHEEGSKRICYFASKADKTTPWQDVVSHAELAQSKGWRVMLFVWEDTPHCNHMAKHEEEYQGVLKAMWTKSKL